MALLLRAIAIAGIALHFPIHIASSPIHLVGDAFPPTTLPTPHTRFNLIWTALIQPEFAAIAVIVF